MGPGKLAQHFPRIGQKIVAAAFVNTQEQI